MSAVPAGCLWGADNINVALLPAGFPVYAGYHNGPFANMPALRARFPKAHLISVATRLQGSQGAMAADAEAGTLDSTQAGNFTDTAAFLSEWDGDGKPIVYTMASWAGELEHYLAMNGHSRSSYYLWVAHYRGQHLCGPASLGGCGYGASMADATQYATGLNDYSVFRGYVITGQPAATASPGTGGLRAGATGTAVGTLQQLLNKWARYAGFPALIVDQDFGGKTLAATLVFQAFAHLTADGMAGKETMAALAAPVTIARKLLPKPKPARPVLPAGVIRPGAKGKAVAEVQYYLRNSGIRGVRGIDADGLFGSQTENALRNFQAWARFKPADIDGVYGPQTRKALARVAVG